MTSCVPRAANGSATANLRVLVVDDLADAAFAMARILQLLDCDARVAQSGTEALQIAADLEPEIVLLDLGLPGIDGFEVARRLRSHPATARSLIVAVSGYGDEAVCERAARAGCDDHWLKPARIEQLTALVESRRQVR